MTFRQLIGLNNVLLVIFCLPIIESELIFNITENYIPQHLNNVFSIFKISKDDKTLNLNEFELICGHVTANVGNHLDINRRTGDIVVKAAFDREEICPSRMSDDCPLNYVLSYKASLKEFKVIIKDTNDNAPIFKEKMKEIFIREGDNEKLEYLLPSSTDADTAFFGIEKYAVKFYDDDKSANSFNEYFKLVNLRNVDSSITPVLKVVKLLDRERVERFSFTLVALDRNQKSGDCKIFVNVIDVNDNSPVWTNDRYSAEIKECTQSKEVLKLEAHDSDDRNTENGRITYEIGEKTKTNNKISNLFHIAGNMLYVDLVKLQDIELYDFQVEVIAKDGGGRMSAKDVNIKILDCNKNKPQIEINQRNPKIQENEKSSVKLTNVIVSDPDRGLNGEFECVIDDSHRFSLQVKISKSYKSGKWVFYTLNTVEGVDFDREKITAIAVLVTCNDRGIPSQMNTQVITVHVTDINDNPPSFTKGNYIFSVEENVQIGIVIGSVVAMDPDSGENGRVSYDLDKDMKDLFSVNSKGQIQTNGELDRERRATYEFKVLAKDNGIMPLNSSCVVKVFVLDLNDCNPEVSKQFIFEIVESRGVSQIHVNLGKINATDGDLGLNGTLNFRIANSNANDHGKNLIQITSDGLLSIYGNVDREAMKTIHFEIIISDNGRPSLSTITTVVVNILDVNDNKPRFLFPNYPHNNFVNVSLQSSIGTVLAVIEATDPDNGSNGSVSYRLMGGEHLKSFFDLHQSGQLILIKSLADSRLNPDRILIQALDGADPPLTEITTLYLRYFNSKRLPTVKNQVEKRTDNYVKTDKDGGKDSANVTLLYGLAAVLFIIFVAGLIALFFIYLRNKNHLAQDFTQDKTLVSRKNYSQTFQTPSNEYKGNDEVLHSTMCETADGNISASANYTHLMFIKDPNYNLLYPRMLSKSELDAHNDNSKTLNYFHYQMNNLSPPTNRTQTLSHQSNPLLMYKDSEESLDESNYNSPCYTNKDKCHDNIEDCTKTTASSISGYTQSYITSTFV